MGVTRGAHKEVGADSVALLGHGNSVGREGPTWGGEEGVTEGACCMTVPFTLWLHLAQCAWWMWQQWWLLPEQNQMRSLRMNRDMYSTPWAAEDSSTYRGPSVSCKRVSHSRLQGEESSWGVQATPALPSPAREPPKEPLGETSLLGLVILR